MTVCAVRGCHNCSDKSYKKQTNVTFHTFPNDPTVAAKWTQKLRLNRHESNWKPTKYTRICSMHFNNNERYMTKNGTWRVHRNSVPTRNLHIFCHDLSNHMGNDLEIEFEQPQPATPKDTVKKSPLQADSDSDASESETPCAADNVDPLSQDGRPQCRFCGEFTKHFVDADSELSYITDNKTSLSVNGINVEIDFNSQAPKTVCVHCNRKLKEMLDFVKLVKFAQDNLIDLSAENRELLIVKTEYDSNDEEDDSAKDKDDTNEGDIATAEKSGCGEMSTHKRKSNATTTSKRKKTKVEETDREESNLLIDIKEENMFEEYIDEPETSTNVIVKSEPDISDVTMETDNGNDANEQNETNKTNLGFREETAEPPDQASELEMATRILINELGDDGMAAGESGHYG